MALPKLINIQHFDVNSKKCPQALKLVLREQLRDVISRRRVFRNAVVSNAGADALLDQWWEHHCNIIRAASLRPEWDWKTLSLHFDQNVARPVNFFAAQRDYLTLLGRPSYDETYDPGFYQWSYSMSAPVHYQKTPHMVLGEGHDYLYQMFVDLFTLVILERKEVTEDSEFTDSDAKLSVSIASEIRDWVSELVPEGETYSPFVKAMIGLLSDDPNYRVSFNKIPKALYEKMVSLHNEDPEARKAFWSKAFGILTDNQASFFNEMLKAIGAHQISGTEGPVKTTLCNKLVKSFYDWLTAFSFGSTGNCFPEKSFDEALARLKSILFFCTEPFKVRNDYGEGYSFVSRGTFEQLFARLQENVKGSLSKQAFIVSFHPCDMITCSLGYNWSSCQSWIDDFTDLPDGYGQGTSYSGMYNRGNFQFMCGNGFVAYVPHEELEGVPQYLWAKKKRCLLWVGDNLDCMRQNYFYPGRPTDQETLAFGKVVREYIQNVCAPFNFSNGTIDWKVTKGTGSRWYSSVDEDPDGCCKFTERSVPTPGRYDDPIMAISYLKGTDGSSVLNYALDFPRLDTGLVGPSSNYPNPSFFAHIGGVCPVCGKHTKAGGVCSHCAKEFVEHNGKMVHPSDLVTINVDGHPLSFSVDEIEKLNDYVLTDDGSAVEFKSAFKVFMPSGIKYFAKLPDYVKQCKVCKEYFHPSFMIGDVCVEHFNAALAEGLSDGLSDISDVLETFKKKALSFDCNEPEKLLCLLRLLEKDGIRWVSGKKASEYVPVSNCAKRMFLSLNPKGMLILSSRPKSTVVKVSNLFKDDASGLKGGE